MRTLGKFRNVHVEGKYIKQTYFMSRKYNYIHKYTPKQQRYPDVTLTVVSIKYCSTADYNRSFQTHGNDGRLVFTSCCL